MPTAVTPVKPAKPAPAVLVVEATSASSIALGRALAKAGFLPTYCTDGASALARVKEHPWHAALVDRRLPDTDGLALLAKLREVAPELPVILLSAGAGRLSPAESQVIDEYLALPPRDDTEVELAVHRAVVVRAGKLARESLQRALDSIRAGLGTK